MLFSKNIFYRDRPVFGLDIGRDNVKVMQTDWLRGNRPVVIGYGRIDFDQTAVNNSEIVKPELIVESLQDLINNKLIGRITTNQVAVALPNHHVFNRVIDTPKIDESELDSLVRAEISQSIPENIDDLYYDYSCHCAVDSDNLEIQVAASPKRTVDMYSKILEALGLVPALFEPSINSVTRNVNSFEVHDDATLAIDLGAASADVCVYDDNSLRVAGSVEVGGETITSKIAKALNVSDEQAYIVKSKFGLSASKQQDAILAAVQSDLDSLIQEIRKVIRYYRDKTENKKDIGQIILLGGGAALPGLSTYITSTTRITTRVISTWDRLHFGRLQPPREDEATLYTTVAGLSLIKVEELKHD